MPGNEFCCWSVQQNAQRKSRIQTYPPVERVNDYVSLRYTPKGDVCQTENNQQVEYSTGLQKIKQIRYLTLMIMKTVLMFGWPFSVLTLLAWWQDCGLPEILHQLFPTVLSETSGGLGLTWSDLWKISRFEEKPKVAAALQRKPVKCQNANYCTFTNRWRLHFNKYLTSPTQRLYDGQFWVIRSRKKSRWQPRAAGS